MKLEVYKLRDLQNFLSMLNQCESAGVTDIRFVRSRLQGHIDSRFKDNIITRNKSLKEFKAKQKKCPHCGNLLRPPCPKNQVEGLDRLGCLECFYSELI